MTFDEWWATYDPDDANTRADREHARMVWEAATAAERERCAAELAEATRYRDNAVGDLGDWMEVAGRLAGRLGDASLAHRLLAEVRAARVAPKAGMPGGGA